MFRCEQQCCENNLGSIPFAAKLNAQCLAGTGAAGQVLGMHGTPNIETR